MNCREPRSAGFYPLARKRPNSMTRNTPERATRSALLSTIHEDAFKGHKIPMKRAQTYKYPVAQKRNTRSIETIREPRVRLFRDVCIGCAAAGHEMHMHFQSALLGSSDGLARGVERVRGIRSIKSPPVDVLPWQQLVVKYSREPLNLFLYLLLFPRPLRPSFPPLYPSRLATTRHTAMSPPPANV